MDSKEKQIMVTAISLMLIFAIYSIYLYNKYIADNFIILNDFKFWGKSFLILIPITIVSQIVIHIVFHIINKIVTNEDIPTISDERDKLIDLKALRISHGIFTMGFLLSMIAVAIGMPPYVMFLTLIASGYISGIVSEIAKIYFYRRGI